MAYLSAMLFSVSFLLGAPCILGMRMDKKTLSQPRSVDNSNSTDDIIVGSRSIFTGSAGQGGNMGVGHMRVSNLKTAFEYSFKPAMERCAGSTNAHIIFEEHAGVEPRALKIFPGSTEAVDYWDDWKHSENWTEKFIGGGLSGCGQQTNNGLVCHVMMKLALVPESGEGGKEEFYVVGALSMGNWHGSQWKHSSRFSLVAADKLQPADPAGFELADKLNGEGQVEGKVDNRQLLEWRCVEPDKVEPDGVEPDALVTSVKGEEEQIDNYEEAPSEAISEFPTFERKEAEAIESGAPSRCCCVERGDSVLAVAVNLPFAVGHWGNRNVSKGDHACPVIAMKKDDTSEVCGCTTKNAGFTFVAESKCLSHKHWTFHDKEFIGEPSHSPSSMKSRRAQELCLEKCEAQEYVATVTSACED